MEKSKINSYLLHRLNMYIKDQSINYLIIQDLNIICGKYLKNLRVISY